MTAFTHRLKTISVRLPRLGPVPLPVFLSAALVLSGCTEGSGSSNGPMVVGEADELFIQPIQVCDNFGNACARVNLFAEITAKILAQAQLKISFLPVNQLNSSRFLSIDGRDASSTQSEFYEMTRTGGPGAFGRHPNSTDSSGPINLWFIDEIETTSGFVEFGLAWVDANGVVISGATLDFNRGNGRTDTIAHEIGHNLGLRHATLGAGGANNLMTEGTRRLIPESVDDIGSGALSQLTDAQIKAIQTSPFVTRKASSTSSPGIVSPDQEETLKSSDADLIASSDLKLADRRASGAEGAASVPEPAMRWSLLVAGLALIALNRYPSPNRS